MERRYPHRRQDVDLLLVEPDPDAARRFTEEFDRSDASKTLHVSSDGSEARDFIHRRGEFSVAPSPNIVLLDPELPCPSGFEILSELKNEPDLKRIPVIVMSGSDAEDRIVRAYTLHANAYIRKRSDPDWIEKFVRAFERFWLRTARLPPKSG